MPETVEALTLLQQLRAKREEETNALATFVEKREKEQADFRAREDSDSEKPSDEERSAFNVAEEVFIKEFDRREGEIEELKRRVRQQEVIEERRQDAAQVAKGTAGVISEPLTYRKDNAHEVSYLRDLAVAQVPSIASRMDDPAGSITRLQRHAAEMNVELPKREQARERRAQEQVERAERDFTGSVVGMQRRGLDGSPFERRTNPNRTDGQGGYFVPPLWLIDEYIPYLRAGRVAADLCRQMDLPPGTDSINIPKLSTSTLTAVQTADAAAVESQDFTDTSVSAGVKTIAGQQDVSIQLIEQSPGQIIDRVVMEDLLADLNKQVDAQVLTGTNANGQVQGLLPVTSWSNANTVTWTSSNFSALSFNQAMGAAASKTAYNRYDLTNLKAVLHPRRWFWFATSVDLTGNGTATNARPLVGADGFGPYNVAALEQNPTPYQGLAGRLPFGVPVYIDGNIPTAATSGGAITGSTLDLGLVAKWDDLWLFEGALRTRVLPEILSGTLQIRFQVFEYLAFLARYGQGISVVQGTGMAAPVGQIDSSITY